MNGNTENPEVFSGGGFSDSVSGNCQELQNEHPH
jgi:hypothetical protein